MKFLLEYNSYGRQTYQVGDIVLIDYWYLDEPDCSSYLIKEIPYTPVRIVEKASARSFKVSHDVPQSKIKNAPDEIVKAADIIDLAR
jgi:hypothetical protein